MISSKKGQGLSINVIIIAALALIVLVVLTVIFTSRSALFQKQVGSESRTELISLKLGYADCHPTARAEGDFSSSLDRAVSIEDREAVKADFKDEINRCGDALDEVECESASCAWS